MEEGDNRAKDRSENRCAALTSFHKPIGLSFIFLPSLAGRCSVPKKNILNKEGMACPIAPRTPLRISSDARPASVAEKAKVVIFRLLLGP